MLFIHFISVGAATAGLFVGLAGMAAGFIRHESYRGGAMAQEVFVTRYVLIQALFRLRCADSPRQHRGRLSPRRDADGDSRPLIAAMPRAYLFPITTFWPGHA